MAMNLIVLLVCIDGYAAAHQPYRSINSSLSPPLQFRRRRCHHSHGIVTATSAPTIAGFCFTFCTSRRANYILTRRHRREQHPWLDGDSRLWNYHHDQHRGTLRANSGSPTTTTHYPKSTSLHLSMEPGDTSDNHSQLSPSQCHNDDDDDDNTDNGNEYNWTSQTIAIAVPSLAGMMNDPLLSLADTLFVGMLGSTVAMNVIGNVARGSVAVGTTSPTISSGGGSSVPLAALGACTSIFHLCFHCFRATTSSTSSLVAAALVRDEQQSKKTKVDENDVEYGSIFQEQQPHQQNEAVLIAQTSIQQSIIMGTFIAAFLLGFGPQCLLAMGVSPHDGQAQLYPSAMTYLNNRSIAAPAVVMLSASEGIFRGYGDVITPWKVSCLVSLLNLILDPYCMFGGGRGVMYGLGMGIKGAAVATALSQVIGALVYGRKLFQRRMLGGNIPIGKAEQGDLKRQKRSIAATIFRANAAMMAKQGSLLLAWAYATSRATRMGHTIVASHQMALSIWLVVALFLDGAGVAAQVLMAREWEGYKLSRTMDGSDESSTQSTTTGGKRRAIKSLSLYMIKLSLIQGLVGSLAILLLRQSAPSFIFTFDPAVRQNLFTLLPHVAYQMTLVSATLVTEALAIGGGRFKWLAGGTTVSAVIAMVELRGAKDLVGIWSGGIVTLFVGRLFTAVLAVMDMNGLFRRGEAKC
ncbi:hypothetical protein ACHAXH_008945 [Discostella pseudostelligera]